ncbi:basic proline-rich protein-like [Strigops habroptila]|uniref:basic proline-rich protein-like n=1 Tax=Strigops habroptila TaxID=2489341 RepID=UPI0011CEF2AF|nr:basic proline-rich protein-like [Strigops habroptila]
MGMQRSRAQGKPLLRPLLHPPSHPEPRTPLRRDVKRRAAPPAEVTPRDPVSPRRAPRRPRWAPACSRHGGCGSSRPCPSSGAAAGTSVPRNPPPPRNTRGVPGPKHRLVPAVPARAGRAVAGAGTGPGSTGCEQPPGPARSTAESGISHRPHGGPDPSTRKRREGTAARGGPELPLPPCGREARDPCGVRAGRMDPALPPSGPTAQAPHPRAQPGPPPRPSGAARDGPSCPTPARPQPGGTSATLGATRDPRHGTEPQEGPGGGWGG